jgi:hypothetical protein
MPTEDEVEERMGEQKKHERKKHERKKHKEEAAAPSPGHVAAELVHGGA